MARNAPENLTRTHLELGGKAPVLVLPDADLELAAKAEHALGPIIYREHCERVLSAVDEAFARANAALPR